MDEISLFPDCWEQAISPRLDAAFHQYISLAWLRQYLWLFVSTLSMSYIFIAAARMSLSSVWLCWSWNNLSACRGLIVAWPGLSQGNAKSRQRAREDKRRGERKLQVPAVDEASGPVPSPAGEQATAVAAIVGLGRPWPAWEKFGHSWSRNKVCRCQFAPAGRAGDRRGSVALQEKRQGRTGVDRGAAHQSTGFCCHRVRVL
ncbi:hypothetical protein B0T21DRAFT_438781 [Apiosordaria backusii]|uniref:Uncharacterized protein n=1 Tax=Apiosordaria backusii TaxID=314023 RepID=A0AA40BN68_9PEZI|nr:hypothetical protein B0T21DRAFT_438781 [Apiosordaria backusii]